MKDAAAAFEAAQRLFVQATVRRGLVVAVPNAGTGDGISFFLLTGSDAAVVRAVLKRAGHG